MRIRVDECRGTYFAPRDAWRARQVLFVVVVDEPDVNECDQKEETADDAIVIACAWQASPGLRAQRGAFRALPVLRADAVGRAVYSGAPLRTNNTGFRHRGEVAA
jgi:hypothetical protein